MRCCICHACCGGCSCCCCWILKSTHPRILMKFLKHRSAHPCQACHPQCVDSGLGCGTWSECASMHPIRRRAVLWRGRGQDTLRLEQNNACRRGLGGVQKGLGAIPRRDRKGCMHTRARRWPHGRICARNDRQGLGGRSAPWGPTSPGRVTRLVRASRWDRWMLSTRHGQRKWNSGASGSPDYCQETVAVTLARALADCGPSLITPRTICGLWPPEQAAWNSNDDVCHAVPQTPCGWFGSWHSAQSLLPGRPAPCHCNPGPIREALNGPKSVCKGFRDTCCTVLGSLLLAHQPPTVCK